MYYKDIVKIYKKMVKKDYWSYFTVKDIFSLKSDQGDDSVFVFVDNDVAKCFGIQLFYNPTGLNFLHDALTIKNPLSGFILEPEMFSSALLPSSALSDEEKLFIREQGCNVKKENNLVIYSYKVGYARKLCNEDELNLFLDHMCYMDSLLDQKLSEVIDNINANNINQAYFFIDEAKFMLTKFSQESFESFPKLSPVYKPFAEQYKDFTPIDDEGYIITMSLPIIFERNEETPVLLVFNYPNSNRLYFDYILSNSQNAKRGIYIPLDNAFSKIGIPVELIVNNRFIYSNIYKTMNLAGINLKFSNDIPKFSNIKDFSKIFKYLDSNIDLITGGAYIYDKKSANIILSELCNKLNENKNEYLFDSDDNYEYNEDNDTDDSNEIS